MNNEYPDRPRVAVGGVVIRDGKVLLVRRGKAPAFGEWAIPGVRKNVNYDLDF